MTIPNTQEGRRSMLDGLLNRLLNAHQSIGFYQRESEKLRKEIHDLLDGMEQLVSESIPIAKPKTEPEPTNHWLESGTLERFRCRCGKEFSGPTEFHQHMDAMESPIPTPEPFRYTAGDGHP